MQTRRSGAAIWLAAIGGAWLALAHGAAELYRSNERLGIAWAQDDLQSKRIVPYVPTPQDVVERMLEMAEVKKGDVVYDLGSGDGRIVVTAAKKYGVKAVGFEIDPERIKESHENIEKAGVGHLVEIRQQDILTVDVSPASVVTMYLLPDVNLKLRPTLLRQLKPGSRIVSHDFDMGDWKPDRTEKIKDSSGWDHTLYLWRIPARK
ncbi:MAG TPA: methyltransferase domain-containing protein [Candidatus Acidoferrales bacterium]|nr:methyltransferase domain-containing protein [Candidatus Acidoferrales bacterium]